MARPRTFTDRTFKSLYRQCSSAAQLAEELNCTTITVNSHIRRLGLKSYSNSRLDDSLALKVFDQYRGNTTVTMLAIENNTSESQIRYLLSKAMRITWGRSAPAIPRPLKLSHIKIVHVLNEDAEMFDDPCRS
jgi:hypothetical protein